MTAQYALKLASVMRYVLIPYLKSEQKTNSSAEQNMK